MGWKWGCQPFSCRCSQNVTHCNKGFVGQVSFQESIPAIPFGYSKHPLPARSRFLRAAERSTCFASWLHPVHPFVAATEKECVSCKEAACLVTELWFPRFVTMQWLCSQSCYLTAANQWTLVEIELLATVGWKGGCQPFSCRCSLNVTQWETRFVGHGVFRNPFLPFPFWNSKHPLPTRRRFLRAAVSSTCLALWLHHAHPFVAAAGKNLSHRDILWLCSQLCYKIAANQRTLIEIELLATVGWKWGCQPFSCRCSQNVSHWEKEICSTSLSKEFIPTIPFGYCKHPLPARKRFLRAAERSTFFALWLHHAHPFIGDAGNNLSDAEKQRVLSRSCGSQGLLPCSDCALSRSIWLLQTNQWAYSNGGLEVGLPAFQLPLFSKCDFVGFFEESIPAIPGYSKHPLPARSRFLRAAVRSTCFAWLHPAHPFVAATEKECVSCREAERLVTELWPPRFVTMQWLCSQLCYVTAANQWTIVEIELLATVGWKGGCRPFSCRCSQNATHCKRRFVGHVSFQESIPAIHFGYSKHPLHSLQLQKKPVLCAEAEGFVTELWLQDLLLCSDCALSCAMWLLQTTEQLSRLSF